MKGLRDLIRELVEIDIGQDPEDRSQWQAEVAVRLVDWAAHRDDLPHAIGLLHTQPAGEQTAHAKSDDAHRPVLIGNLYQSVTHAVQPTFRRHDIDTEVPTEDRVTLVLQKAS